MLQNHPNRRRTALQRAGAVAAALALAALAPVPAGAIIVPDDAPTIQAAIDSGADEVLVRPGFYPETLRVGPPLTLRGLPVAGKIPEALGLILDNAGQQSVGGAQVSDFRFRGPVRFEFHNPRPMGPLYFDFSDCVMDSGLTDQPMIEWDQIDCDIVRCRISGGVHLEMPQKVYFVSNVVQGPVRLHASANGLYVRDNLIEGPGVRGISGTFQDYEASIIGNTIRGFDVGIYLEGRYHTRVRNNLIENCPQAGIVIDDNLEHSHSVSGNVVRACGIGIGVNGAESVWLASNTVEGCVSGITSSAGSAEVLENRVSGCDTAIRIEPYGLPYNNYGVVSRGNRIEHCDGGIDLQSLAHCTSDRDTVTDSGAGIRIEAADAPAAADSAVVLGCGGAGITLVGSAASATRCVVGRSVADGIQLTATSTITLDGNTSFLNGGAGFAIQDPPPPSGAVTRNIGFGNLGHGLTAGPGAALTLTCNDWFGNTAGATGGLPPGATDLAVDPYFCNPHVNDVHLAPGSPLGAAPGCGLIGALGLGCADDVTPTLVQRFDAERFAGGVRVRWRVAGDGTRIALERATALVGPWITIATQVALDGSEAVALDAEAPQSQSSWYRLMDLEAGRVVAGPIEVAPVLAGFALARVGPVPASGPIALGWTLPRAAEIEVMVLDVQGRAVARLARGMWPAGSHAIEWSGDGVRGRLAPGLYRIRYRFPGGQDFRNIVIAR